MNNNSGGPAGIDEIIEAGGERPLYGRPWFWAAAAVVAVAVVVAAVLLIGRGEADVRYETEKASTGTITVVVSATGTLEPTNQVEVGTEVSGTVEEVFVDFNDRVKAGTVLARLDTEKLEAQVKQSDAAVESARAQLLEAEATVAEATSELDRVKTVRELTGGKVPSRQNLDVAEATLKRALAVEATARARISETEARLNVDRTNLEKAVIKSPIDGIVLKRQVEEGTTVAASLQTPVLFTIAENLTQMELHVAVDEADVGSVAVGQKAAFTVDAYPDRTYPAVITEVRFSPQTIEGVVTYETVMAVDNSDLTLRPGMTATAEITTRVVSDVLVVPNAALRFTPPSTGKVKNRGGSALSRGFLPRFRRPEEKKRRENGAPVQRVWTLKEGKPVAVTVTTGVTDGRVTEIRSGDIAPGTPLVVDAVVAR